MLEGVIRDFFKDGAALFVLPGGRQIRVGEPAPPEVVVRVRDTAAALRIARRPSLALGEAFMDGGFEMVEGDLYGFLDLVGRNRALRPTLPPGPFARAKRIFDQWNDRNAARAHIHHHYDLSLDLYRKFLDEDLQYSCAYFDHPGVSLEDAQAAKKRHLIAKLLIEDGASVLDIGCGWGGLALSLAEQGARVTGVTLSDEQLVTARKRARARGFAERAEFRLQDYRDVTGPFDRIVSVGMLEHVGRPNYQTYFDTVARLLKDDGVAVIHSIGRKDGPNTTQPWIAKYIFPGGYIPALSEVLPHIEKAGLWITDVEILRLHYAETLREWRKRFVARRADIAELYDERFCRMWEFYLASSEIAFRYCGHMVFQLQLTKRIDAVPITRDYMEAFERGGMRRRHVA